MGLRPPEADPDERLVQVVADRVCGRVAVLARVRGEGAAPAGIVQPERCVLQGDHGRLRLHGGLCTRGLGRVPLPDDRSQAALPSRPDGQDAGARGLPRRRPRVPPVPRALPGRLVARWPARRRALQLLGQRDQPHLSAHAQHRQRGRVLQPDLPRQAPAHRVGRGHAVQHQLTRARRPGARHA